VIIDELKTTINLIQDFDLELKQKIEELNKQKESGAKEILEFINYLLGIESDIPLICKYDSDPSEIDKLCVGELQFSFSMNDLDISDLVISYQGNCLHVTKYGDDPDDGYVNDPLYIEIVLPFKLIELGKEKAREVLYQYYDLNDFRNKLSHKELLEKMTEATDENEIQKRTKQILFKNLESKYDLNRVKILFLSTLEM
jgi:hypothetical protein